MIKLTKFKTDDHEFVLNAELIETIEETPDTVITLTTNKKLLVMESMDEVVRRVMEYRRLLSRNMR
jgi:flagellar protein FlbD